MAAVVNHATTATGSPLIGAADWNANHVVTGVPEVGTVTVDFGASGSLATATLTASWITASSVLVVSPGGATDDHDPEDVLIEEIKASVSAVAAGSCTVMAFAPNGTWGRYTFNVVGI
jgi:hypothetical protein